MKFQFIILFFIVISCSSVQSKDYPLVFVHGAHFSSDSYDPLLKQFNRDNTYSVDLPNDPATALEVTLNDYSKKVCDLLRTVEGKSVVAGHSQGGAVINHAFGICPEKIKALIYIASTIPLPGEKPFALFGPRDDEYYFSAIEEDKKRGLFVIKDRKAFLNAFIQDGTTPQRLMVEHLLQDEPILPSGTNVSFDIKEFNNLQKLVLITTKDRVISPQTQRAYAKRLENKKVSQIESGHLPMITRSEVLHEVILKFISSL